jgi:hypothetical protein
MKTNLRAIHLTTGVVVVLIFLGTGLLMRLFYSRAFETNYFVRMLFRASHIYILLAGLLNIALGSYLRLSGRKSARSIQVVGSICILLAPILLIGAFFYEPFRQSLNRPMTLYAMILLLTGTLLHMLASIRRAEA